MKISSFDDSSVKYIEKGSGDEKITVTSGLHGNEISPIEVNKKLIQKWKNNKKLLSFPICNFEGFLLEKREHSKYGDLNRNSVNKKPTKKIYDKISNESDFHIDLHSWNERSEKFIIVSELDPNIVGKQKAKQIENKILKFTKELNMSVLVDRDLIDNLTKYLMYRKNIPSVTIEVGDHKLPENKINNISEKILNGLKFNKNNPKQQEIYTREYYYTENKGKIEPKVEEGEQVEEGEVLCYINNKNISEKIEANDNGWVTAFNENLETTEEFKEICHFAIDDNKNTILKK